MADHEQRLMVAGFGAAGTPEAKKCGESRKISRDKEEIGLIPVVRWPIMYVRMRCMRAVPLKVMQPAGATATGVSVVWAGDVRDSG